MNLSELNFEGIGEILIPECKLALHGIFKYQNQVGHFWPEAVPDTLIPLDRGYLSAGGNVLWPIKGIRECTDDTPHKHYRFSLELQSPQVTIR